MEATGGDVLPFTPENLISKVFLGDGVTVTDIQYSGAQSAVGFFDKGQSAIGIEKGIVLTTGSATKVTGMGADGAQDNNDLRQEFQTEPDLQTIANGAPLRNVSKYTIKFIPTADTLRFRYVFASEEYPEFVCSEFNDVFGFFISGPGINGSFENGGENIAKIPGTNLPVAINFVNNGEVGVWGVPGNCNLPLGSLDYKDLYNDNKDSNFQPVYDGYTNVFTAQAIVVPCQEYTIKLTVADVSDEGYDSGVFLEAKSFGTRQITVSSDTYSPDGAITEGCTEGYVKLELSAPSTIDQTITYNVFGTAENGVDYARLSGVITIPAGETEGIIEIKAKEDGILELTESVYIDVAKDNCTRDTIAIFIKDNELHPPFINDTTVCPGSEIIFDATIVNDRTTASTFENDQLVAITPHNTTVASDIEVSNVFPPQLTDGIIESVCIDIQHNNPEDLDIYLRAPNGNFILLSSDNGTSATNYQNTCFKVDATQAIQNNTGSLNGNFQPEESWANLWETNCPTNGTWTLLVRDDEVGSTGLLKSWSIAFQPGYQLTYEWLRGTGITCTDCPTITVAPDQTTEYEILVTDSYGCFSADTATITTNSAPVAPTISCTDATANTITFSWDPIQDILHYEVRLDGGSWTTIDASETSYLVENLAANAQYTLEIKAIGICEGAIASSSCTTVECPMSGINASVVKPVSCFGLSDAEILINNPNQTFVFDYTLDNDLTNQTGIFTQLPAGDYVVTISTNGGCPTDIPINIPQPPAIELTAQIEELITCYGRSDGVVSAAANGGTAPFSYEWEDGTQADTLKQIGEGTYSVIVSDANGCQNDTTITLSQPDELFATTNSNNVTCYGAEDGNAIILPSGGTLPYQYEWEGGQTIDEIKNLEGGDYNYTVTDNNGCAVNDKVEIKENPQLILDLDFKEPTCFGRKDGVIELKVQGGSGAYSFDWNSGQNTQAIGELGTGSYSVVVTDTENCKETISIQLSEPQKITIDFAKTPTKCANSNDGSAALILNGGVPSYNAKWSDGFEGIQRTDLAGGNYFVTVSDANNCKEEEELNIPSPQPVILQSEVDNVKCFGDSTGQINVMPSGGVGTYDYAWSNDLGTSSSIANLEAGVYEVEVMDDNGCGDNFEIEITQPEQIASNEDLTHVTCFGKRDGRIETKLVGGVGTHEIEWNANGGTLGNDNYIEFLKAGTYELYANDENGCIFKKEIEITQPDELIAYEEVFPISCIDRIDGEIMVDVEGGTAPYTIKVNDITSEFLHIRNLEEGEYKIEVIDANNCVFESESILMEMSNPLRVNLGQDTIVEFGTTIEFIPEIDLLYPIQNYDWSPIDQDVLSCVDCESPQLTAKEQIAIKLRVTDEKGCTAEDIVNVFVKNEQSVFVPSAFSPNQDGTNDKHWIHGKEGTVVENYRIYDRWGELLYEEKDFNVNDKAAGWDGIYRSKNMSAGVYIWYVEVRYENGSTQTLKGDVTLIR